MMATTELVQDVSVTTSNPALLSGEQEQCARIVLFVCIAVATVIGGVARFHNLGRHGMWIDEFYSVVHASQPWDGKITKTLGHLPVRIALCVDGALPPPDLAQSPEAWGAIGVRLDTIRMPAALIGVLTIPALALVARRSLGWKAAAITAFLVALAPWHVHMSTVARFYALQFLLYNLALLWYLDATRRGSRLALSLACVCTVIAVLVHEPSIIIGVVFAVDVLIGFWRQEPPKLGRIGWALVVATGCLTVGLVALDVAFKPANWEQFAERKDLAGAQSSLRIIAAFIWLTVPVIAVVSGMSGLAVLRSRPSQVWFFGAAALIPILAIASAAGLMAATARYAYVAQFAWLVLAGIGLASCYDAIAPRLGRMAAMLPILACLVASAVRVAEYHEVGSGHRERWSDAVRYLADHRAADEPIYGQYEEQLLLRYYLREKVERILDVGDFRASLADVHGRIWIVDRAGASGQFAIPWLEDVATLRAEYGNRVWQPYSAIRLYSFEASQ